MGNITTRKVVFLAGSQYICRVQNHGIGMNSNKICVESIANKQTFGICLEKIPYLASVVLAYHHRVKMSENALCCT